MTTAITLTDVQRRLLIAILRAERVNAARSADSWFDAADRRWEEIAGPRYTPGEWFPDDRHPSMQRAFLRAVVRLTEMNLVEPSARWGERLTNVMLSSAGRALAEELELAPAATTAATDWKTGWLKRRKRRTA